MPLLYDPGTGMPYEVPISEIDNFLRKGFRSHPPFPPASLQVQEVSDVIPPAAPPEIISTPAASEVSGVNLVNVNAASLKDLAALPLMGTASAKKVRDNRPYASVEDLIAKVPDVDWLAIREHLTYEVEADAANG